MLKIKRLEIIKRNLKFRFEAKTSRNTLTEKPSYFILLEDDLGHQGIGECAPIFGLSLESEAELESKLDELSHGQEQKSILDDDLSDFPSIQFGLEIALKSLERNDPYKLYNNGFSTGKTSLSINGLIWMSEIEEMHSQIEQKIADGFTCIKLKIGSHALKNELELLRSIRQTYNTELELRLDANGAFSSDNCLNILEQLAEFDIHSIEQPIKAGQWSEMADICKHSPIPIALDEELIGVNQKTELLDAITPQYLILKPSLLGGFKASDDWIQMAELRGIQWWATSALESNIGLNAIAQWLAEKEINLPQGLGTGQIYSNNLNSPLYLKADQLHFDSQKKISFNDLNL